MMQHVDRGDRVQRARAKRKSVHVAQNPTCRYFMSADFNHLWRPIKRDHRKSARRQGAGVVAGASADFEDRLNAQHPKSVDQRDTDRRLDAPRVVIRGGDLPVVDGSRNRHDNDSATMRSGKRCSRRKSKANDQASASRTKEMKNGSRQESFSERSPSLICYSRQRATRMESHPSSVGRAADS
jgi:hypothetical protein